MSVVLFLRPRNRISENVVNVPWRLALEDAAAVDDDADPGGATCTISVVRKERIYGGVPGTGNKMGSKPWVRAQYSWRITPRKAFVTFIRVTVGVFVLGNMVTSNITASPSSSSSSSVSSKENVSILSSPVMKLSLPLELSSFRFMVVSGGSKVVPNPLGNRSIEIFLL